jgi:hypothetical protein
MNRILQLTNVLPLETNSAICSFIEENVTSNPIKPNGHDLLNCFIIGSNTTNDINNTFMKVLQRQCLHICETFFQQAKCCSKAIISPIQFRKVFGPTKLHADGIEPFVDFSEHAIYHRIATVIITLNENTDCLHFPEQDAIVSMTNNTAIIFPPYAPFLHETTYGGTPRFSILFWILGSSVLQEGKGNCLNLVKLNREIE